MNLLINNIIILSTLLITTVACDNSTGKKENSNSIKKENKVTIPSFNSDSAYYYIKRQIDFGPRVPNMSSHKQCAKYLTETLNRFSDTVYIQETTATAFDGTNLNLINIIGSFNPENRNRILLAAHWDTRPFADKDPNPDNFYTPIDGANDGASGVAVLLEIARLLSKTHIEIGVDIILFDGEDYGVHSKHENKYKDDTWALGSQYWSKNPHISNYNARFGILLDMVGAYEATFKHEGYSMYYAPNIVRKVWETARHSGFEDYFINRKGGFIMDDHYYINKYRNIPTINIIHQEASTEHGFFKYWHTTEDTIDKICKNTLNAVGQTVVNIIFQE